VIIFELSCCCITNVLVRNQLSGRERERERRDMQITTGTKLGAWLIMRLATRSSIQSATFDCSEVSPDGDLES
jgi:hypothetical protein